MPPKYKPNEEYTLKISFKYVQLLHFYEFSKFDQFRHRRKGEMCRFAPFFTLFLQPQENNYQLNFLPEGTSKPEPFIFQALILKSVMTKFHTDISNNFRLTWQPTRSVFAIFPHILAISQKMAGNKCKYQIFRNTWLYKTMQNIQLHCRSNVA